MTARFTTALAGAFALLIGATLAFVPPAAADDATTIETCLKAERDAGHGGFACIGRIAKPCMKTPGGETTVGMIQCQARETQVWDTMLNSQYQQLMAVLEGKSADKIRAAQRAWIIMRDGDCALPYDTFEGGTIAGVIAAGCMLDHTAMRALQVQDLRENTDLR
jgi:uncharacterized protein YecT (DUF1311 family)